MPRHAGSKRSRPFALIRDKMRHEGVSALILALFALPLLTPVSSAFALSTTEGKKAGSQQWRLRVDKVDTGDVILDPSLKSALYKNLLKELAKTKRFKQVALDGDRNANDVPDLLILKTTVREHAAGSGARWAGVDDEGLLGDAAGLLLRFCGWTIASGASKLNAHIRLYTREGQLVLNDVIEGDVGFTGNNSRAAHNLAHNIAVAMKRSTLPDRAIVVTSEHEAANVPKYQVGMITAAQCRQAAETNGRATNCEVSVTVGNTAYGVLYAAPAGTDSARYETGRELLVLVGEDTITYNDMLGNSFQVPILTRASVTPSGDR